MPRGSDGRIPRDGCACPPGLPTPALDLAAKLCTIGERGLAGLAVHPNFAANRFIYLYYTYNHGTMTCLYDEVNGPVNRLMASADGSWVGRVSIRHSAY